jgi:hypothetical protein
MLVAVETSPTGKELFYRDDSSGSLNLVAVEVKTSPTFSLGRSTVPFPVGGSRSRTLDPEYAVSPDDRRTDVLVLMRWATLLMMVLGCRGIWNGDSSHRSCVNIL